MNWKFRKRTGLVLAVLFALIIVFYNNQSVKVSGTDAVYIGRFLNAWHLQKTPEQVHKTFQDELNFISAVQDSVIARIKHQVIPRACYGNVAAYYQAGQGQCFDRAVLMEKIFSNYRFQFRHVYLYFAEKDGPTFFSFFKRHLPSHALLEVKTKNGWTTVGTNSNWLGITPAGKLLTIGSFRKYIHTGKSDLLKKPSVGTTPFWQQYGDFRYVYGLYSRHGDFFTRSHNRVSLSSVGCSFHLLPDYNLKMLFYNF